MSKRTLKDYVGALKDLDKTNVHEINNEFILKTRGDIKRILEDYVETLEDLDKAHVLDPNNAFTLSIRIDIKKIF
jgi:tetratricopeptide (TPR) repeat protein